MIVASRPAWLLNADFLSSDFSDIHGSEAPKHMAEQDSGSGGKPGKRRPPEKTFGDVRLGIRAGTRRDERPRREKGPNAPTSVAPEDPAAIAATGSGPEEVQERKGPIVERKGGGLVRPASQAGGTTIPGFRRDPNESPPSRAGAPTSGAGTPEQPNSRIFHRQPKPAEPPREPPPAPELVAPVEHESFAELFARSTSQSHGRIAPGQKLTGRILQIGRDTTFLELAGASGGGLKTEALIDSRELRDENGDAKFKVGDEITGYVKSLEDGVWLTTALPKGAQREALQGARASGMPVEGTIIGINKGGLEVDLGSGIRGFVPMSQASARFTPDFSSLVGQRLQFMVTEVKDRDVVLSRRALLEREAREKADALRDTLVPGIQLEGIVTSLREFGAFVDLGGLEGLIPISELTHRRVGHPEEVLKVGQPVTVEVLRVEQGAATPKAGSSGEPRERVTLSLKRLEEDPWMVFGNAIVEGQRFKGKVVRLQPFGAFVELSAGVDGLVHVSKLVGEKGGRVTHPEEVLKEGQEVWVEVEKIDRAARKIGLRPLSDEEAALPPPPRLGPARVGDIVDTTVDKVESFGLFVRWPGGRGLLPASELGTPRGSDLRRSHPVGTKIKAQVVEVDGQNRIRLSATSALQAEERKQVDEYIKENQPSGRGLGTLGDLLKKRLQ
jgi:small subunit ribosomal protein S1